jgi:hypothetical protein
MSAAMECDIVCLRCGNLMTVRARGKLAPPLCARCRGISARIHPHWAQPGHAERVVMAGLATELAREAGRQAAA